jgi:hypothetical protein
MMDFFTLEKGNFLTPNDDDDNVRCAVGGPRKIRVLRIAFCTFQ